MRNHLLPVLAGLTAAACSSQPIRVAPDATEVAPDATEPASITAHLTSPKSCDDLEARARDALLAEMNETLDRRLAAALAGDSGCHLDAGASGAPPEDAPDGATDYSTTNNQVAGVNEPDFVKNDAGHIYVVANGKLRIIDAWPAAATHTLSEIAIEGEPKKLFVADDRALVYSSLVRPAGDAEHDWFFRGDCTYGYHCDFVGDGHPTKITVFDITDRANPALEREIWLSGSFVTARRINHAVYTVLSDMGPRLSGVSYWPPSLEYCVIHDAEVLEAAFAELREANTRIITESPSGDWLPGIRDSAGSAYPDDCSHFYLSGLTDGSAVTTLLGLDITSADPVTAAAIVSRPGAVYGSANALYMSVPHERGDLGWYDEIWEQQASTVHKLAVEPATASVTYSGSGVVPGRVLNQFSMDEHDGRLRVATTSGWVPDPEVSSTLTVLQESDGALVVEGQVSGLAPTEDIRSVRFAGDRGFVVTFKKTDPLFVFDLSDPADPRVMAELKIPGFSTYMHFMDEDHLLTIGYDADDQGSFAWFTGVMLQIFDVAQMSDPQLVHKEIIGARGSSSVALTNHLAFNYFAPKDLLALPMTVCEESGGGGSFGEVMSFSGLMVYDVTAGDGFSLRGRVNHPPTEEIGCNNWWTDGESQVKRSVIMDDWVYSISESRMKVNALADLATDLVEVDLAR